MTVRYSETTDDKVMKRLDRCCRAALPEAETHHAATVVVGMTPFLARPLILSVAFVCFVSAALGAEAAPHASASPAAVVQAFYAYHFAHDMGFTEASVLDPQGQPLPAAFSPAVQVMVQPK